MDNKYLGETFNKLTILEYLDKDMSGQKRVRCRCECGREVETRLSSVLSGHTKSCGHHRTGQDMVGKRFGKLIVLERAEDYITPKGNKHRQWLCQCDCGNKTVVRGTSLRNGHTVSCGCQHSDSAMGIGLQDITGNRYGRWTVLYQNGHLKEPRGKLVPLWRCRCDCGEERDLRAGTLKSGQSLSCGCYKSDVLKEKAKEGFTQSEAERIVLNYLQNNGFYFESQKIFSDLRGNSGYPLPYDFLVYVNGSSYLLIECQGVQHYQPVEFFGGKEYFPTRQKNDALKKLYAINHGYNFLEIPYFIKSEENIHKLLKLYL